ncbi:hypothetical protein [Oceanobacillus bengalensis]|uniref:hypothetical protein n=1 Tax=Oceanobacillus bengalensis TaxID=1435466 RepID=UPI0015FFA10D|nr:hypothetical protein [Oceanobacillus bengalensis]
MGVELKAGKRFITPFLHDNVGSFLRPEKLKEARAALAEGTITESERKKVEDECIIDLIEKQKAVGLQSIGWIRPNSRSLICKRKCFCVLLRI